MLRAARPRAISVLTRPSARPRMYRTESPGHFLSPKGVLRAMGKPYLGIWLDHREVFLIWASDDGVVDTQHTTADYPERVEKGGLARSGGVGVYGGVAPHSDPSDKQHKLARHFYDRIYKAARKAQAVFIFGPGLAKQELRKRLGEHRDFNGRIQAVESAERMTEPQMAARVREFFSLPRSAA